jgi:hypothetical protein
MFRISSWRIEREFSGNSREFNTVPLEWGRGNDEGHSSRFFQTIANRE